MPHTSLHIHVLPGYPNPTRTRTQRVRSLSRLHSARQVELILTRAIDSLAANGVTPDRDMWLKQAEEAVERAWDVCGGRGWWDV